VNIYRRLLNGYVHSEFEEKHEKV